MVLILLCSILALASQAGGNGGSYTVMVYDMGGGTLDVSLLNLNNGIFEVSEPTLRCLHKECVCVCRGGALAID